MFHIVSQSYNFVPETCIEDIATSAVNALDVSTGFKSLHFRPPYPSSTFRRLLLWWGVLLAALSPIVGRLQRESKAEVLYYFRASRCVWVWSVLTSGLP